MALVCGEQLLNSGRGSVIFDLEPNRIWQQITGTMRRSQSLTPQQDIAISNCVLYCSWNAIYWEIKSKSSGPTYCYKERSVSFWIWSAHVMKVVQDTLALCTKHFWPGLCSRWHSTNNQILDTKTALLHLNTRHAPFLEHLFILLQWNQVHGDSWNKCNPLR